MMFLLPGPPIVSGYTKPLILLPSESVWVSLSRTMEKTTTERDAEETRKRGRKGDRRRLREKRTARQQRRLRVSSSERVPPYSTPRGGSSITQAFEIFVVLPTAPGITLEIDVAQPRNLGPYRLLDFSRFALFFSPRASEDEEEMACRNPGAAHGIRAFVATRFNTSTQLSGTERNKERERGGRGEERREESTIHLAKINIVK